MLDRYSLKEIPVKYRFEYLKSYKRLIEIKRSLNDFYPIGEKEEQWTKLVLKEYYTLFKKIKFINKKVKNVYNV